MKGIIKGERRGGRNKMHEGRNNNYNVKGGK